jgi:urease accessory protein
MSVVTLRSERSHPSVTVEHAFDLERCDGACELRFSRGDAGTSVRHLFQRAPCRVLFPNPAADDLPLAVLLTTSGGLTGGDRLRVSIGAEDGAQAVVTTQAAEKIYRSLGSDTRVEIALSVGPGAWLEWLPQETILFDRARLRRRTMAEIASGGRLLAAEMIVFGRTASGERVSAGFLHDRWTVQVNRRLRWVDAIRLEGDMRHRLDAPAGFDGAAAIATVIYVGPDGPSLLPLARALALDSESRVGASLVDGILLARFIAADARALRADLADYLAQLRRAAAGLPARVPRLW